MEKNKAPDEPADKHQHADANGDSSKTVDDSASWKRPFKNAGILLLGRGTQGILSLVYLALAARTLGTNGFGYLALIHSFAITAAQIMRFQSWQAVLKYGADAIEKDNISRLQDILTFSVWLDLFSAVIGIVIIQAFIYPLADLFQIRDQDLGIMRLYTFGVIFIVMGSGPTGVLRLFNRHDLVSIQSVIEPLIRFTGAIILFINHGTLQDFLILWFLAMIISRLSMIAMAWIYLIKNQYVDNITQSFKRTVKPNFITSNYDLGRFVIGTHITTTLSLNNLQLGTLLCGWVLGPAAAGLFRVAQQFADVIVKPAQKLLVPAIYTDMAELTAKGDKNRRRDMIIKTSFIALFIASIVFSLFVFFGDALLIAFAGENYANAHILMILLSVAGLISIITFPLEPLLITEGAVKHTCMSRLIGIIIYVGAFYVCGQAYGLNGAGYATILYSLCTGFMFFGFSLKHLNRLK